jgi:hypothetical protein
MNLLRPYRTMAIGWMALAGYLLSLNTAAGVWYYNSLPAPQVASVPVASAPVGSVPVARAPAGQQSDSPTAARQTGDNTPGKSRSTEGPGKVRKSKSQGVRPPIVVEPPAPVEIPPSPAESSTPMSSSAQTLLLEHEPAAVKLRRRLLVLVLVSTDLVNVTPDEEQQVPLRENLQGVLESFRSDLAGGRIYAVGQESKVAPWDLVRGPGELVRPFEIDAYDTAIAAAGPAIGQIVAPDHQAQYDILLVWYSHFRPDDAPRSVALPAELAEGAFLLWAGTASHEDSALLSNLFPGRRWLLRQGDSATTATGLIIGQLRKPAPEGALP